MYNNIMNLKDKVIVLTGGSGLIGKEFCRGLSEFGAKVIIGDIDEKTSKKVSKELNKDLKSEKVFYFYLDMTSEDSIDKFIKNVETKFGKIDVLINNAYPKNKKYGAKFEKVDFDSFKENIISHMGGYFLISQRISERMKKHKSGVIVNIASIYGALGPNFSVYEGTEMTMPVEYSMIKGGIINFTKYLSTYLAHHNIRVNSISPGGVYNGQNEDFIQRYCEKVPLGRMANPSDIVGTLIFLVSDASEYITGQNIFVDGGLSAW